jgi:hypothetical protein
MDYKEFLVSVEIAEALKKIGFDKNNEKVVKLYDYKNKEIIEPTWEFHYRRNYFDLYLSRPNEYCPLFTYEQVFAWFREKEIYGHVARDGGGFYKFIVSFGDGEDYYFDSSVDEEYGSYEYARIKCIEGLIEAYKEVRE